VDEEGSNLGRILLRVEQIIMTVVPVITAEKCLTFTPAATTNNYLS